MASVTFLPMEPRDLLDLVAQPSQAYGFARTKPTLEEAEQLARTGCAWTVFAGARLLACAGIIETFAARQGVAWAVLASYKGAAMVAMTRYAARQIAESPLRRIEAIVRADDPSCAKLAAMIGLSFRAVLPAWGAESQDHLLFDRVR